MTTTAHEDQFTAAPEPVREPMSREAILRQNVAALEVALRTQTELKERAEAELKMLREQKLVAEYDGVEFPRYTLRWANGPLPVGTKLYAAPVHAPAVPAAWREVMAELVDDVQADCDAKHPHREQYPFIMRRYNNDMELVEKARALLKSAPSPPQSLSQFAPDWANYQQGRKDGRTDAVAEMRMALSKIPVRRMTMSGQRLSYVQLDELNGELDAIYSKALPEPAP